MSEFELSPGAVGERFGGAIGDADLNASATELRTLALASSLAAKSDALDRQRAAEAAVSAAVAIEGAVVDRPGAEPSAALKRQWALAQVLADGPVEMDTTGGPLQSVVFALPDTDAKVVRVSAVPQMVVITPSNADEVERMMARQARERENQLLIRHFGEERLLEAGIIP